MLVHQDVQCCVCLFLPVLSPVADVVLDLDTAHPNIVPLG